MWILRIHASQCSYGVSKVRDLVPGLVHSGVVQLLNHVQLFVIPWTVAHQASLSFTISWSVLKLMSFESVMPSNHLILCRPLLLPSIFHSIRVFSNESTRCLMWPKYWSFSISLSNENSELISFNIDWFDPLMSKRLSRVFYSTTFQRQQFLGAQPFLLSNSHIHSGVLEKP